jgi:hypothetical protein
MATILDDQDEKDKAQNEQVLSNGSGTIEGQGSSGASAQGGQGQPGGGGFTNLQQYVTANQGNDAAMGQKVEQNVGQNAQAANQNISQYQSGAENKVKQGTVTQDQSISDALKTSPEKIVADPNMKSAFDKQYNAQFTGDTQASAYQGYNEAQQAANKVQTQGQEAAGDNASRRNLLNDVYARPDYATGQQTLDSFLLGAGDQGQQSLKNINQQYGNYGQKAADASQSVQDQIQQGIDTSKATQEATRGLVNQQTGKYDAQFKGLQDFVGKQQGQMQSQYQGVVAGLSSADAGQRAAAFKQVGLDPKVGEFLVSEGYSPAQLVQAGKSQSLGDVADQGDVAHYQALAKLQGLTPGYDFSKAGGGTAAFTADQGKIGAANQAQATLSGLQAKLAEQKQQRALEYAQAMSGPVSFKGDDDAPYAAKLGISNEDLQYAKAHGIDPTKFVSKGRDLGLGDVTDDPTRAQFGNLMNMLGLKAKEDLTNKGPAGGAFTFGKDAFAKQVADARAKEAAAAAPPSPSSRTGGDSPGSLFGTPLNTGGPAAAAKGAKNAVNGTVDNAEKLKKKLNF